MQKNNHEKDFLIVGQGLAGTLLSYELVRAGKSVVLIDEGKGITSSRIAAGLYNPVTGKRMVKTWLADQLFPLLEEYYSTIEKFLGTTFLYPKPILRIFDSLAEQNYWYGQSSDPAFRDYIELVPDASEFHHNFRVPFGGFYTKKSGYVAVAKLLDKWKEYLLANAMVLTDIFRPGLLQILENSFNYRDVSARNIIFCEGYSVTDNPYFSYLKMDGTKGQILHISADNFQVSSIVNKGVFVLPENGFQKVGSTYERKFTHQDPTEEAEKDIISRLEVILKSPYRLLESKAAVRPTVIDRKPLLGVHPEFANMFVFNGLGTKGVSLGPYFAGIMKDFLLHNKPLPADVDIQRFAYLYH